MIRRTLPDGDLLIPQVEHARLAARLAARMRDLPEPREALVRAVALHDAGWTLFDDAPEPLEDGRAPHVFDHPAGATLPAWRRSVAIARASGRLEALVVSRHFSRFSPGFAAEQAGWQAVWTVGLDPSVVDAGVALLAACDAFSLRLLCDPDQTVRLPAGIRWEGGAINPWPFAGDSVDEAVTGRLLPRRSWSGRQEFRAAWNAAPTVPLTVRIRSV